MKARLMRDGALYLVVGVSLALALFGPTRDRGLEAEYEFDAPSEWLTAGWSLPERMGAVDYIWGMAPRAVLRVPVEGRRDRVITFRCWPITFGPEPQRVTLSLNGHALGTLELERRAQTRAVFAPAEVFAAPGEPNQLALSFGYSLAPAEGQAERRPLAVAFDWIRIGEYE